MGDNSKTFVSSLRAEVLFISNRFTLERQGYDVIGIIFMKTGTTDEFGVCTAEDYKDVAAVADQIGIPYYLSTLRKSTGTRFWRNTELVGLGTQMSCVIRKSSLKPSLDYALTLSRLRCWSGHYAQVKRDQDGLVHMLRQGITQGSDLFLEPAITGTTSEDYVPSYLESL